MKSLLRKVGLKTEPLALWCFALISCWLVNSLVASESATLRTDASLQNKLQAAVADFRGEVGVYVRHLGSGQTAAIRADELFPTASMVKVPILLAVFDRLERGELGYHDSLVYADSLYCPGADILGSFKAGEEISVSKLVMLMITMSDNTASLWLQSLVGTGVAINAWLETNGVHKTRMNSRTPGRHSDWEKYGWGQTTPREMAELLVMIREGRAVSESASEEIYRVLSRSYWDGEALSQLPPQVQVASKQGAVNESRSEVALVNAPSGDYVFCVLTNNQEDTSWKYENEGFALLRKISFLLWQHFEPDSKWTPNPQMSKWR